MITDTAPIGVVGLSHLGVTVSGGLASLGFTVLGVDSAAATVSRLQNGDCLYPEPLLPELFRTHASSMKFTLDFSQLASCDRIIFAEDTIITEENEMDLHRVHALIDAMIPHLKNGCSILFKSQVPVGFTRALQKKIHTERPDLTFRLYYWVDVLVVGDAVARFLHPGRITIGYEATPAEPMSDAVLRLLQVFDCPVLSMNYESAEITKSAMNVYLATTVTFANAISNLCEVSGADMKDVITALRLDKRVGPFAYIQPGVGFSGGHLERDLVALTRLAKTHKVSNALIDLIQNESAARYEWLKKKIESMIFTKNSSPKIAIWGLSYKKNTDSLHGAPSLKVIRDFAERAELTVYDPAAKLSPDLKVTVVSDRYKALAGADALLILSNWDEFADLDVSKLKKAMKTSLIIDPLGVLGQVNFAHTDVQYVTMGKSVV